MALETAPYVVRRYIELSFELNEIWALFNSGYSAARSTLMNADLPLVGNLAHIIAEAYDVRATISFSSRPFDEFFELCEYAISTLERFNRYLVKAQIFTRESGIAVDQRFFAYDPTLVSLELDTLRNSVRKFTPTHTAIQHHLEAVIDRIQHHTQTILVDKNQPVRAHDLLAAARDKYFDRPIAANLRAYITVAEDKSAQIDSFALSRTRDGVTPQAELRDRKDEEALDMLIRDELLTVVLEQEEESMHV